LSVILLAATAGCEQRLVVGVAADETGASGTGGGTTTTSSASAGTGGGTSVGPAATCAAVMQATPVLTVDGPDYGNALQPSLVVLASTPPKAAVAYVWQPSAPAAYTSARVASFAGWGAWPPPTLVIANVGRTSTGLPLSGVSLLAQSNPSSKPPSLDLLYAPTPIDDGSFNNWAWTAGGVGLDGSISSGQLAGKGTALFLANGGTDSGLVWPENVNLLSGVVTSEGETGSPKFDLVVQAGPNFGGEFFTLGCSTTPLAADAVTDAAGWLLAAGLGTAPAWKEGFGPGVTCGPDPSIAVGPGTKLTLAKIQPGSNWVAASQVLPMSSPISRVRMANRPGGGAWIVWSLDGEPTLTAGVASGALQLTTMPPVAAARGTLVPTSFAVESLGDSLVVAAVDQVTGGNDQVQVGAMDVSGATLWTATVPTDGTVDGALSLRAAPDGSALLLAWSELPPGGTTHRLRVARIDCATCAADGVACATGSDCCSGLCKEGTCASTVVTTDVACKSDADCMSGTSCDPRLGTCVGGTICSSDADCTWGNVCDTTIGMCTSPGSTCASDADCPAGQGCSAHTGVCLPGTCTSPGGACTSDHDCCSLACDTSIGSCK
jgi:hypothetical protein